MMNKRKLLIVTAVLVFCAVVESLFFSTLGAQYLAYNALSFAALYYTIDSVRLPKRHLKFFALHLTPGRATYVDWKNFADIHKSDPEFAHTVQYLFKLSPDELLDFSRVLIELRYNCDQTTLGGISEYLRRRTNG